MVIYEDNKFYSMTLIVTVHNGKDIVVGADSLTTVKQDGIEKPDEEHEKILLLNEKTAILVAGYVTAKTLAFLEGFVHASGHVQDANQVRDNLLVGMNSRLLDPRENWKFVITGFHGENPVIHRIMFKAQTGLKSGTAAGNYYVDGFPLPSRRAEELLKLTEPSLKAGKLKMAVKTIVDTCIDEFKEHPTERLGGRAHTRILYRD